MRQRRSNLNNDSWPWVHRCVTWSKFWMCLIANDCSCKLKKSNPFKWQAVISLIETSWLVKFISTLLIVTAFKSLNYFLFIRACSDCVAILLCLFVPVVLFRWTPTCCSSFSSWSPYSPPSYSATWLPTTWPVRRRSDRAFSSASSLASLPASPTSILSFAKCWTMMGFAWRKSSTESLETHEMHYFNFL